MISNTVDEMWQRKMNPCGSVQNTGGKIAVNVCQEGHENILELNQTLNTAVANGSVLGKEKSLLSKELEETKAKLQRQKFLTEMYINKGKETRQELETLRKYSDPETLSAAKTATLVWDGIKKKNKRELQNDLEELRVAFIFNEGRYEADLMVERNKNMALEHELERLCVLANKVDPAPKPDASTVRDEVDTLRQELKKEAEQKNELLKCYEELKEAHRISKDKLTAELRVEREKNRLLQKKLEKISEANQRHENDIVNFKTILKNFEWHLSLNINEIDIIDFRQQRDIISLRQQINSLPCGLVQEVQQKKSLQLDIEEVQAAYTLSQQNFETELQVKRERNKMLLEQLEVIGLSHQLLSNKFESDVITLTQQAETLQSKSNTEVQAHELVAQCEEMPEDVGCQEQQTLADTPEEKEEEAPTVLQEEATVSEEVPPETKKTPSAWKRMRHFLGLRKPKRWKKKETPA